MSTGFDYGGYKNNLIEVYLHQLFLPRTGNHCFRIFHATSDIVTFLHSINAYIHQHWQHEIRIEPGFQHPLITFSDKRGSCRDLAYMMMEMLKSVGLASRFVSGYAYNPSLSEEHNLHAWIDIYMPGAGWIGIDPKPWIVLRPPLFPLAASYEPSNTLPVIGTFGVLLVVNSYFCRYSREKLILNFGSVKFNFFAKVALRDAPQSKKCHSTTKPTKYGI
ncbi:MAG: transglutaminase domain-containing protein [Saprospiraceae bacterium]|nr:transglutaminase domain-containing protein [Saprospiraceae bacterium]